MLLKGDLRGNPEISQPSSFYLMEGYAQNYLERKRKRERCDKEVNSVEKIKTSAFQISKKRI